MKIKNFSLSIIISIMLFLLLSVRGYCGILGNTYVWQDTLSISGTYVDSLFSTKWEYVECWTDSVDWYAIIGASTSGVDTANWNSRKPLLFRAGDVMIIGPELKLRRLKVWTRSGTGILNMFGEKKTSH